VERHQAASGLVPQHQAHAAEAFEQAQAVDGAQSACDDGAIDPIPIANELLRDIIPHSFRDTLVQLGKRLCGTPEEFEAWSKNLGHEHMLTTFRSYGTIDPHRQGELIKTIGSGRQDENKLDQLMEMVKRLEPAG
jgi:hypothetical protein